MKSSHAVAFVVVAALGAIVGTIAVEGLKNWARGRTVQQWLQATP